MKIAIRVFVLTVVLATAGVSQSGSFAGPGWPVPPSAGVSQSGLFAGPGWPVPPSAGTTVS